MVDEEQVKLEKYYDSYREMFNTEGWKTLLNDLRNNALNINSVEATKDETDLHFRKGQLVVIASMLNLETQIKAVQEEQASTEEPF
jgi:hypothetical protein|tara:strand:+ start:5399 stop:5656 length:258 start_codon:yes stop_codon:yes gene_type:complete